MNARDEVLLRDMLDAARDAQRFTTGRTRQTLQAERMFALALVKAIEIIGEAASKVSPETRALLPQIPWKDIIGMRNKTIHDYRSINYSIVWETATNGIPALITELEKLLPPEDSETSLPNE